MNREQRFLVQCLCAYCTASPEEAAQYFALFCEADANELPTAHIVDDTEEDVVDVANDIIGADIAPLKHADRNKELPAAAPTVHLPIKF